MFARGNALQVTLLRCCTPGENSEQHSVRDVPVKPWRSPASRCRNAPWLITPLPRCKTCRLYVVVSCFPLDCRSMMWSSIFTNLCTSLDHALPPHQAGGLVCCMVSMPEQGWQWAKVEANGMVIGGLSYVGQCFLRMRAQKQVFRLFLQASQ